MVAFTPQVDEHSPKPLHSVHWAEEGRKATVLNFVPMLQYRLFLAALSNIDFLLYKPNCPVHFRSEFMRKLPVSRHWTPQRLSAQRLTRSNNSYSPFSNDISLP